MGASRDKQSVALTSVVASAFLTLAKLVAGLLTGSLGILSEAVHSLLDLGAAALTYFAVRLADQPADTGHPYGHKKVESVAALIETGLLFLTSLWIIKAAIARLMSETVSVEVHWYSVGVVLLSIAVDASRSRALMKVAKATKSQALEADALHFSSDILSSAVVLVGLGGVALGWAKADAVAAIGVSLFVFHVGYQLGKRTIDVLMDAAPQGVPDRVLAIAGAVDGVVRVDRVRVRPAGSTLFIEALIRVSRTLPLDQVQGICDAVTTALAGSLPEADCFIKAEPLALDDESIIDTVQVVARRRGFLVHDIAVETLGGQRHVSFDIEVDEKMNIKDAHDIASSIENGIRGELGDDVLVDTHIDPRRFSVRAGAPLAPQVHVDLAGRISALARQVPKVEEVHEVQLRQGEDGLYVSLHCLFPPATPVREVHRATAVVEQRLREHVDGIGRVIVHAEPAGPTAAGSGP